jgi:hypothetical protein
MAQVVEHLPTKSEFNSLKIVNIINKNKTYNIKNMFV